MGMRTMVSPNRVQAPQFPPLNRQGSLFNLTFDEIQTQFANLSKPLNTMTFDELLKNVISAEEAHHQQLIQQSQSSSSSPSSFFFGNFNLNNNGTLSKKTTAVNGGNHPVGETTSSSLDGGGILTPQPLAAALDPMVVVSQQTDWLQLQMAAAAVQQQQMMEAAVLDSSFHVSGESVFENAVVDVNYISENHQLGMSMPTPQLAAAAAASSSDNSQVAIERKRRVSDEMMEKTIERRQKRMIKNRESAARSRARKQAYTNQLENEVFQLRKTNSWLKKQKEVEMLLSSNPSPVPKYQLRRTSSAPF